MKRDSDEVTITTPAALNSICITEVHPKSTG